MHFPRDCEAAPPGKAARTWKLLHGGKGVDANDGPLSCANSPQKVQEIAVQPQLTCVEVGVTIRLAMGVQKVLPRKLSSSFVAPIGTVTALAQVRRESW